MAIRQQFIGIRKSLCYKDCPFPQAMNNSGVDHGRSVPFFRASARRNAEREKII
jgi:hypothetical protein